MGMIYLIGAIVLEVFGSSMMKLTTIVKSRLPIIGITVGYITSFYFLSLALVSIPLSFGYAVWSGLGTALTAIIGVTFFKEKINWQTGIGITLLIVGIVLMRI